MQAERSSFEGILTNDDDSLVHLHSLMKGRSRSLLFKPPFDSHGGVHLRSEQQLPWLLRAESNGMTHRRRESAAGCLDAVVPG
jgi:hypothetical protein